MYSSFRTNASPTSAGSNQPHPKPKRAQVNRACDACRIARAKCDTVRPCRNCKKSGRECVSSGTQGSGAQRPVSAQSQEIERLRARVQELEAQQQALPASRTLATPPVEASPVSSTQSQPSNWKGITKNGLRYGPISDQVFIHRLSTALSLDVSPTNPPTCLLDSTIVDLSICNKLERSQQDYFSGLFWMSYHVNFPALDEADFRKLYASLWREDGTRDADPLVDIFVALNMQYAFSYLGDDGSAGEEAAVAGKAFFHRCQVALGQSLESPSLKSLQCFFFSAVYLSYAKCYVAAHSTVKTASNMLSTLSTDDVDQRTQDLYARVARCISVLDIRLSFKLGRFTPTHHTLPSPPPTPEEFDWSIYHVQLLKLCQTVNSIYANFKTSIDPLLTTPDTFYTSASIRDHCATILATEIKALDEWVSQVPSSLQTPRLSGTQPFTTHRSVLDFQDPEPQWVQRQRLALECQYHSFCITLLRPFIHFAPTPLKGTYNADSLCIRCVNHAIMLTSIIAQGFKETDILTGCYQAFEWQQDAAYALAGFATGYPVCPATPSARKALAEAGETFNYFGQGNQGAVRMATLTKEFDGKIRERIAKFRGGLGVSVTPPDSVEGSSGHGMDNIDPRLRNTEVRTFAAPSLDSLSTLWPAEMDDGQLWPMDSTPISQDLWGSFLGGDNHQ